MSIVKASLIFFLLASSLCFPAMALDRTNSSDLRQIARDLESLGINSRDDLTFKRLGGTTATNWMVKDSTGAIANLKCTSGNTNHYAAVAVFQMGLALDLNIYPVAVPIELSRTIGGKGFQQNCAVKEWMDNHTQYFWTKDTFTSGNSTKRTLARALNCSERLNFNQDFHFRQTSNFGSPQKPGGGKTRYSGKSTLLRAAKDFSNMMVMDVVIGNDDRFPGGNTFFRSDVNQSRPEGSGIFFEKANFYSLDNEASFKTNGSNAERDMKNFLSRFDRDFLNRLKRFQSALEASIQRDTVASDYPYLSFRTQKTKKLAAQHVVDNINDVLNHVEQKANRCGSGVYF